MAAPDLTEVCRAADAAKRRGDRHWLAGEADLACKSWGEAASRAAEGEEIARRQMVQLCALGDAARAAVASVKPREGKAPGAVILDAGDGDARMARVRLPFAL